MVQCACKVADLVRNGCTHECKRPVRFQPGRIYDCLVIVKNSFHMESEHADRGMGLSRNECMGDTTGIRQVMPLLMCKDIDRNMSSKRTILIETLLLVGAHTHSASGLANSIEQHRQAGTQHVQASLETLPSLQV